MRFIFLVFSLATIGFDLSSGCSSSSQPSKRTIPQKQEKKAKKQTENKVQVTSKIRPISFEVEWVIENFETLAIAEVEELKSDPFTFQDPDDEFCPYCRRYKFQLICNPYISYQEIAHLDFHLKKMKPEGDEDDYPTLGYFSFDAKYINYEMFSKDQTYLGSSGSSRGTQNPINFGIGKGDDTVFRIYKGDIKSKDLKVGMNITILFQV